MGFDGLDVIKFSNPQIATVAFSRKEWALKAFGQIYRRLSVNDKVQDEIIPHQILENFTRDFK
jgi:DNA-binding LacI/PurR family transcriptional regulator